MKKRIVYLVLILVTVLGVRQIFAEQKSLENKVFTRGKVILRISTPTPTPMPGVPLVITIPKIKVDARIESVGKDKNGLMDIPKIATNTAWYNLGVKPGEIGNAVIAGHLDTPSGAPSVFYYLSHLERGDVIEIADESNIKNSFKVTDIRTYKNNNFPIFEVFGPYSTSRLNLITCSGVWDSKSKNYSDRIVVFSEKI